MKKADMGSAETLCPTGSGHLRLLPGTQTRCMTATGKGLPEFIPFLFLRTMTQLRC